MNKEQLMEYLNAVCDAENAIQACKDAEEFCENQLRMFPTTVEPAQPALVAPDSGGKGTDLSGMGCLSAIAAVPIFCAVVYIADALGADDSVIGACIIISIIIAIFAVSIIKKHIEQRLEEKKAKEAEEEAEEKNKTIMTKYAERKTEWERIHAAEEKNKNRIKQEIAALQAKNTMLQELLNRLYAKDVIYHTFRNCVAVNQIRAYLEMGICTELEGPNGAYSVYMHDVRTARIVGSITDMKQAVMSGFSALAQSNARLYREMRSLNQNFKEMGTSMEQEFQGLRKNLNEAATIRVGKLDASLSSINHLLETSAHNQYIALRHSNVDSYLLKNP